MRKNKLLALGLAALMAASGTARYTSCTDGSECNGLFHSERFGG